MNQGKHQEAEEIYKELIITGTKNHNIYSNLAVIYLIQGWHDKSIPLFRKSLELKPNNSHVHINLGNALKAQGDLSAAIDSYHKAIEIKPNYPEAHNNLGNALKAQGDLKAAVSSYNKAIEIKPNYPNALNNLGLALNEKGDLNSAIASFNNALQLNPNFTDAHFNLGNVLKKQGDLIAAIASYNTALQLKPDHPYAYFNLGNALKEKGDLKAAITSFNRALQLKPDFQEAHFNLGNALKEQGDPTAAIDCFNKAIEIKPNYPDAHIGLGNVFKEQGDLNAAIVSYNKAIDIKPNYPEAHCNLGAALQQQGDLTAAIASFNKAIDMKSNYPEAFNNLGTALFEKGDLTVAISTFKKALELMPDFQEAHISLGNTLQEKGDLKAAITSFNKALELKPDDPEAYTNLATAELLIGNYKKGWETYEYRLQCKTGPSTLNANPLCKQWSNETIFPGSQVLLVSEQGLGDTLQFMRYAIALKSRGASVSLCAPHKLHTLIQTSGIDPSPLTPQQANKISDGQWIPLLSVPKYLEVSPQNPIITEPYIKTTEELRAKWNDILSAEQRPIIGINWQGNPSHETTNSKGRSLPLETFATIAHKTNASLLSLQKGFGSEQLETCSFKDRFVSCQDQINDTWDFLETAAIIANCDLVITSDTSVAHLAGGMGKTTWLLLKQVPEWRWGLEGDSTFWYPSMRLFRQNERGNWNEVLERVAIALQEHFGGSSTLTPPSTNLQSSIQNTPLQAILAPISLGELIDKITILQIKAKHLQGAGLENVKKELEELEKTLNNLQLNIDFNLIQRLKEVNQDLWQIEDDIRDQERQKNFGETFIRLARSVYQQNDRRAAIKKEINTTYGSALVEEKSYKQY